MTSGFLFFVGFHLSDIPPTKEWLESIPWEKLTTVFILSPEKDLF